MDPNNSEKKNYLKKNCKNFIFKKKLPFEYIVKNPPIANKIDEISKQ